METNALGGRTSTCPVASWQMRPGPLSSVLVPALLILYAAAAHRQLPRDEHYQAAADGGLRVDRHQLVLALLEGQRGELAHNLRAGGAGRAHCLRWRACTHLLRRKYGAPPRWPASGESPAAHPGTLWPG